MKNKRYQLWLKINLPLLVTLLSANVQAQIEALTTEEEVPLEVPVEAPENWYQAEVILFTQDGNSRNEAPPKDYVLEFPENWLQLTDPEEIIANDLLLAEDNEPTSLQAFPVADEASDSIPEASIPYLSDTPEGQENTQENFVGNTPQDLYESFVPEYETPFVELEVPSRDLNESASALDRRGYGVLFHEAWRFQITDSDTAPWIVIKAGATDTDRFQLEGSIRFYQSRFLHFETNLWRLKFTDILSKPLELPDLPVLDTAFQPDQMQASDKLADNALPQLQEIEQVADQEIQLPATIDLFSDSTMAYEANPTDLKLSALDSLVLDLSEDTPAPDSENSMAVPEYPIEAVWVMKKSQRIQEAEVYYLDHPEMGVLVTIKSYEPELLNPPMDTETANEFIEDLIGESNAL